MLNFKNDIAPLGGWLTEDEGMFLYDTAKAVEPKHTVVEIGSWKGKSTICLGRGAQRGGGARVFAVDPHTGSPEHRRVFGEALDTFADFTKNIERAGVQSCVLPVRDASVNVAKRFTKPIGFVFIDGAHDLHSVKQDFASWFPKVVSGGVIAFHDAWHLAGPQLFTSFLLLSSRNLRNPRLIDTITSFEKVGRNTAADRIHNLAFFLWRTIAGVYGFLKLKLSGSVWK